MKKIVFVLLSFCLAQEMEVDGGLTVTEGVTAASFVGNGGGLTGIGIKPDRVYSFGTTVSNQIHFIVPENKLWIIHISGGAIRIEDESGNYLYNVNANFDGGQRSHALTPGTNMTLNAGGAIFYILEYSISGSGTEQGMDYIEP